MPAPLPTPLERAHDRGPVSTLADEIVGRERERRLSPSSSAREGRYRGDRDLGRGGDRQDHRLARDPSRGFGRGLPGPCCRPAGAEVRLSFAALADLFDDALDEILPSPRRSDAAARLPSCAPTRGDSLEERAIFAGIRDPFAPLAASGPLAIAVDDAQWLDQPSADALEFAARRLQADPVLFVTSIRTDGPGRIPLGLDRAFGEGLLSVDIGALSLGAVHRVLRERTGRSFTRPVLRRIDVRWQPVLRPRAGA